MMRNYEIETLEEKIRNGVFNGSSVEEVAEWGLKIAGLADRDRMLQEILTYHIAESKDYPMNNYTITKSEDTLQEPFKRTIYTYTSNSDSFKIFEQNFYCGYGVMTQKGLWIGLLS